ncbi:MAG TPA: phosphatidylinositol mannoside acyltransferase [Frankiaceae bacterium]|nr:phosphatidylinositol mannoside acyltransferase [Frankiaceae bacterium]
MRDRVVLAAYVAGWALLKALPERLARRLFDLAAVYAARRQGKGTRRLRTNLARVAPDADLDALTLAGLKSYGRYWLEMFRLPTMPRERVVRDLRCEGEERLRDAATHGGVAALPHMGNWDLAGAWASMTGMKFTTVAERLKPEGLFDRFVAFRESLGMEVVPLTGGVNPFDVLVDRVRSGHLVCLMADRDLTERGVEVTFFGETAKFPAGPAALALKTGTPLLPATLWFEGDGWVVRIHEAIPHTDVATMTQGLANVFEEGIREHPEDWHMLQRLWLSDLTPRA